MIFRLVLTKLKNLKNWFSAGAPAEKKKYFENPYAQISEEREHPREKVWEQNF
jgi:hypothetical protein